MTGSNSKHEATLAMQQVYEDRLGVGEVWLGGGGVVQGYSK